MHHVSDNGKLFSGLYKAKKQRPKSCQGIIRCRPKNSEAMAMRSGAHGGLMCPLEKGARGIEIGHQMPGRSWQQGRPRGDGKPAGPDRPLGKGMSSKEVSQDNPRI